MVFAVAVGAAAAAAAADGGQICGGAAPCPD